MKALIASVVVAVLGLACGPGVHRSAAGGLPAGQYLITAEQIEKSGAHTAWQALKQNAPMLNLRDDSNGRPASITRRGRSSLLLDDSPMILLDGARVPDFHALDTIDAQSIVTILIYDGVEGTTYYGTDAVSGVIVITTKTGRPS